MERFSLLELEWNEINGFVIGAIRIDFGNYISSLVGIDVSMCFLYIDLLFFRIKVFDKTD